MTRVCDIICICSKRAMIDRPAGATTRDGDWEVRVVVRMTLPSNWQTLMHVVYVWTRAISVCEHHNSMYNVVAIDRTDRPHN
jgi:hypothetical protein